MPYDEADGTDPLMLVGVELPAGESASLEVIRVFAEEYARMGFGEEKLMEIFRNPFYAGAHRAWLALGDERAREEVRDLVKVWGRVRYVERDADPESGIVLLPVLEGGIQRDPQREKRCDHA